MSLRHVVYPICDTYRRPLLERMFVEGHSEKYATQHPYVNFLVNKVVELGVAHFGGPIGVGSGLPEFFDFDVSLIFRHLTEI